MINLRTTYMNEEKDEIIAFPGIAYKYMKSPNFIIDLLSTIPFDLIHFGSSSSSQITSYFKLLKILRLLRLSKVIGKINSNNFRLIGQLLYYLVIFLLVLHWFTLIWIGYLIKRYNDNYTKTSFNTWLPNSPRALENSSLVNPDDQIHDFYDNN